MRNPLPFAFSLLVYLAFWACLLAFIQFVGDFGILKSAGWPHADLPRGLAIGANLALIALFGLQHSLMARPWFKRLWPQPAASIERSVYVLASVLLLCLLMAAWQPLAGSVWSIGDSTVRGALYGLFAAGWLIILVATIEIDHWHFFGLRQAFAAMRGRECAEPAFHERGLYARVRHPIHFGMLLALWSAPDMSEGRLLLAGLLTVYVMAGLRLEERDLLRMLGWRYDVYRMRVPMLLPFGGAPRITLTEAARKDAGVGDAAEGVRTRSSSVLLILATLAGLGALAGSLAPESMAAEASMHASELPVETLRHDGRVRSYRLFEPVAAADRPALILALHGSGVTGEAKRNWVGTRLEALAEAHGFLVAYPDGFEQHWNDCRAAATYSARRLDVDDIGFLHALVTQLQDTHRIDPDRVFAIGFSNGGQMAYRLALEAPDLVRAVAALGAGLPTEDNLDCAPSGEAVPALVMLGRDDQINPVAGGSVMLGGRVHGGSVRSAEHSAGYFAALCAACRLEQAVTDPRGDLVMRWTRADRPWVELHLLADAGHTVAQPDFEFPEFLGATRRDVDSMDIVWRFFSHHDWTGRAPPAETGTILLSRRHIGLLRTRT
jgi:polyhydroxybutyrate depolymerase